MSGHEPPRPIPVVLVVDDHDDTREMYTTFLSSMGLEILEATTCAEALAAMPARAIDVVVLDRRLPDGDGADVARALKADARTQAVAVIVLSGQPASAGHAADVYLLKPVIPDTLYDEIQRLLAGRR
jgi:CheY-like chemotaxis protein